MGKQPQPQLHQPGSSRSDGHGPSMVESDSEGSESSSDEQEEEEDGFSDWGSSMHGALRTASLFGGHPATATTTASAGVGAGAGAAAGDSSKAGAGAAAAAADADGELVWLDTPVEAVEYDARVYGWDQREVVRSLGESPEGQPPKNKKKTRGPYKEGEDVSLGAMRELPLRACGRRERRSREREREVWRRNRVETAPGVGNVVRAGGKEQ